MAGPAANSLKNDIQKMLKNLKFLARLMAYLQRIDPATPLSDKLEPELKDGMEEQAFMKKLQILIEQGEIPDKALFLLAGYVMIYYIDEQGEIRVVRICYGEQIIAIDAFMGQKKSPYYVVSAKEAVTISISYNNMQQVYANVPGVEELAVKTAASYEKLERQRDELLNKPYRERILEFYSDKPDLLPAKKSPLQDKYIASYLRMNIDTFRLIRRELKNEGLLNW